MFTNNTINIINYCAPNILEQLSNPKDYTSFRQVCKHFSKIPSPIHTIILSRNQSLHIYNNQLWHLLNMVHTLDLSNCQKITNVSALGNVHTLHLSFCKKITDVSALGNVQKFPITGIRDSCEPEGDFVDSKKLHTLNLSGCYQITDVSALDNVHVIR